MTEILDPAPEPPASLPQKRELLRQLFQARSAERRLAPLSFAQRRQWLLHQLAPGEGTYNISAALRLRGRLDVEALAGALAEIVRRHEALRTQFRAVDGEPMQVIVEAAAPELPLEDLSHLPPDERTAEVQRRARVEAERPIDLSTGPLLHARLLRVEPEEHVLLLCVHHIVSDGWSMRVLMRELSQLYAAFARGAPSPLAELPIQYADYARWQRRQLQGEVLERQLAYWRDRLAGAPTLLELPTDRPRPAVQSHRGAFDSVDLPAPLVERLKALERSAGATLFMVLTASFQVLLARYSGSEDVVVGSPVAGRTRAEVADLIGLFVNTLALRTDLSGDPAFRGVLEQVREATLAAYDHQDLPFEKVVEALQVERSLSRNPLVQVMVGVQEAQWAGAAIGELALEEMEFERQVSRFDLTLFAERGDSGLRLIFNYATDLFDAATVRRMMGHYVRLLEQVADAPERRLSQLELLDESERRQVLVEWNRTEAAYPADLCIHELFQAQVERTPEAVAVAFEDQTLTYRALNERANRLAHHLRGRGVGPEVRVGLCLERGPEMVVSLLAVLKAGGAYVPLDPDSPADRLGAIVADSGARIVLTQERLAAGLPPGAADVVCLDARAEEIARAPESDPAPTAGPENLAYVIYTSGSTGTPKGVAVEHRGVVNLAFALRDTVYADAPPRPLRVSVNGPLSFDTSVKQLVQLLFGHALHPVPEPVRADAELLGAFVRERALDVLDCTPVQLRLLLPALLNDGPARVLVGGEGIDGTLWEALAARRGFWNVYGPTECTVDTTARPISPGAPSLGRPIPNVRVYVLDARGRPVPVGVPGELCVAGAGVARGYLDRPAPTAEKFVPDPFGAEPGARLYRTGDRVRWRADGELEFLGRLDDQVKIRGFRIEPGEVEHALRTHPRVREAVVMAREDVPGDRRLAAYVVADDPAPSVDDLRRHLKERLPEHMVPGAFAFLDRLPLTPGGKVARRALPAPEVDRAALEAAYVAPRTPTEELLAGIWAEVLRVERVGAHDDFFALGGHSLLVTQVLARVRRAFRVELPLRALFEGPTVAELAARVEPLRRAALPAPAPVARVERTGALPLSFAQERLWFLDRLEGGSIFYNVPAALRLAGTLDAAALERALGEVVRRHEALRTTFREVDGGTTQVIAPFDGFVLAVEDLSALQGEEREAEVGRRATEEAARPFDLSAGPLFRARLLRLGEAEHVLLLCMHHIVSDGWSMRVFARDLSRLYAAFARGEPSPLPELPIQYADYAAWQRAWLQGEVLERQLGYWRERLEGVPALLELPTDRPRPAVQSHHGANEGVELPAELAARLEALGRREGATLFMILMGAFQLLLSRYSGSDDVVVGTPIAGRTRAEVEDLVGVFVNTLVLRTGLSGDPTVRELLQRVRETALDAYAHQDLPFEKLVEELRLERSFSRKPLVQVMLAVQEAHWTGDSAGGLAWEQMPVAHPVARFDLTLFVVRRDRGVRVVLNYSTDLFQPPTIRRMLGHYARLLEQAADAPERRLSQLDLMGKAERRQVLVEWNATAAAYPADRCLHELFQAQAERSPHAPAVVFEGRTLTYLELNERANRLGHHLRRRGVGPEVRVGLCLDRGPELIVSLLAVLKAGGAYVPLDPAYPAERLGYMLRDSRAALVLTQGHLRDRLAGAADEAAVVSVEDTAAALAGESADDPVSGCRPGNLAYVMYTSGSTGRPKGVAVQHRSVVNLLFGTDYAHFGPDEVVLQLVPVSFDPSSFEIWGALLHGGRLAVFPPHTPSVAELEDFLREAGVTTAWLTSGVFHAVVNERPDALAPLRQLLAGGDVLSPAHVRRVVERYPALRMVNGYGPTETTTFTTCHRVTLDDLAGGSVPLGGPIGNTRLYVLDASLAPVPIGVPGELYVGGDGLARGYLGRPALTAEKFVPDPVSGEPGARLYRVGDRVRWLAGGTLEFLGRIDQQVKIRGFRIELGEVEHALAAHAQVREAVAVAREDAPGDRRLVGYVVPRGQAPTAAELRELLRASLPEHMVPGAFVFLERLPLTPNGKVDRRALPAPEAAPATREEAYAAPRTPAEELLAGIWTEVLGVERVGVHDDFFALGGHSLLAMQVLARVRRAFRVELPLRTLFEASSVAELAARVEQIRRAEPPVSAPLVPVVRTGPLPLSFAQERLWFLDRLEGGSPFYNMPSVLRMAGPLDTAALERALGEIVRRHEALRTTFREAGGVPEQVVAPFDGFALRVEDLAALEPEAREAQVRRRAREEGSALFDLSAGPLFRARLLRLDDAEHVLLLCMHHVVSDGWSMQVFARELSALYTAFRDGRPSPLPALPVQYVDYAAWQRTWLRGEVLQRQLGWWRERLAGAPSRLELPADRPRPAVQSHRGAHEALELPAVLVQRLEALGRGEGATLFMVLLAAFQVLLARYSGSDDVVVGSPTAGRTSAEVEGLIGFFVNTLVLRTDLSGDPELREVLARVRAATLGAYEHQDLPFEKLVEELRVDRSLSRNPLFQVMLALQETHWTGAPAGDLAWRQMPVEHPVARFDLTLFIGRKDPGLRLVLNYATDLFDAATIRRMLGHLARLLEQAADAPERRLSQLELLSDAERRQLLVEWNATDVEYPADRSIHALFREQVQRTPDAVAVVFEDRSLTYRQLDEQARRLAGTLRRLGVGPEVRVALCLERGVETVVSLVAILQAGGAYVPLDPAYPAERLAFMLADCGAAVLLTQTSLRDRLPARTEVQVVCIDGPWEQAPAANGDGGTSAGPGNLAYAMYTSGSTGTPRGVGVEHRSVVRLVRGANYARFGADEVILQAAPVSFDASTLEIWGALLNGGRLVMMPAAPWSLLDLGRTVRANGVTTVWLTAGLFQVMAQERLEELAGVRQLMTGGEVIPPEAVGRVRQGMPDCRLIHAYGPTENTTFTTCWTVPPEWDGTPLPIGTPISNTRVYVLDAALRPVPVGVPGELYTGGDGVARGYLNRPARTAERFVPDPFAARPGARMYRSGDRVRWRADGVLEFMARLDEQVKIRGYRIEPGEVEAVLRRHPGVAECVVVAREDEPGQKRLVAYAVAAAGPDALRDHLKQSLPEYMVPGAFVMMERFPLTLNGKVDRRALPPPELEAAEELYVAPRTPAEEVLEEIWTQVLGVERVGVHDNFFALGGHSLLATRVVSRIQKVFGVQVPVRVLFEGGTIAALAESVEAGLMEQIRGMTDEQAEQMLSFAPAPDA